LEPLRLHFVDNCGGDSGLVLVVAIGAIIEATIAFAVAVGIAVAAAFGSCTNGGTEI
jgi:hypothetical protein